jgi:hypothetical protein
MEPSAEYPNRRGGRHAQEGGGGLGTKTQQLVVATAAATDMANPSRAWAAPPGCTEAHEHSWSTAAAAAAEEQEQVELEAVGMLLMRRGWPLATTGLSAAIVSVSAAGLCLFPSPWPGMALPAALANDKTREVIQPAGKAAAAGSFAFSYTDEISESISLTRYLRVITSRYHG